MPIALDGIRTCISGIRAHSASDCTTTAGTRARVCVCVNILRCISFQQASTCILIQLHFSFAEKTYGIKKVSLMGCISACIPQCRVISGILDGSSTVRLLHDCLTFPFFSLFFFFFRWVVSDVMAVLTLLSSAISG